MSYLQLYTAAAFSDRSITLINIQLKMLFIIVWGHLSLLMTNFPWIDIEQFVEQFTYWKHSCYLQNLTTASNSDTNIWLNGFTQCKFSPPLGKILRILDRMGRLELWLIVFVNNYPLCLPRWPHCFTFPSAVNEFLLFHVLVKVWCLSVLVFSCPNGWLVVSWFSFRDI